MSAGSAGARERASRRSRADRRPSRLVVALAVVLAAAASSCAGEERRAPEELLDGSPLPRPPVELEGVESPIAFTRVRVRRAEDLKAGSAGSACIAERGSGRPLAGPVVERIAVRSESVTFAVGSGGLLACDNSAGPREDGERWCGGAFGLRTGGRLRDPRLDVLCATEDNEPLAFAWVEPHGVTRFVAVEQAGLTEVYEAAARLPVRVASTEDVDVREARAELSISEHDARGALVRRYRLRASVAG